jgi:hypothetical protein
LGQDTGPGKRLGGPAGRFKNPCHCGFESPSLFLGPLRRIVFVLDSRGVLLTRARVAQLAAQLFCKQ